MGQMEEFLQSVERAIGHIENDLGAIGMAGHLEDNVQGLNEIAESTNDASLEGALGKLGLTAAIYHDLMEQLPAAMDAVQDIKAYVARQRGY